MACGADLSESSSQSAAVAAQIIRARTSPEVSGIAALPMAAPHRHQSFASGSG